MNFCDYSASHPVHECYGKSATVIVMFEVTTVFWTLRRQRKMFLESNQEAVELRAWLILN